MANAISLFARAIRKYSAEACEQSKTLRRGIETGQTTSPRAEALRLLEARRDELLPVLKRRAMDEALDSEIFDQVVPVLKECEKLLDRAIRACWGLDWFDRDPPVPGKARSTKNISPLPFIFQMVEDGVKRLESTARAAKHAQRVKAKRSLIAFHDDDRSVSVRGKRYSLTPGQWNFVQRLDAAEGAFVTRPKNIRWDRMYARLPSALRQLIETRTALGGGYRIKPLSKPMRRQRP